MRRPPSLWASAPATYCLLGINCAVFLAMMLQRRQSYQSRPRSTAALGRQQRRLRAFDGEWWRIVTAMFVHVGILHLATNMWCLWNLGLLAEPLMGSFGVFAVYMLTGAAGNLLSTLVQLGLTAYTKAERRRLSRGAGASGAVFGIAGALIVLLKSDAAGAPGGIEEAAQVGHLFCRHQPGHRLSASASVPSHRHRHQHRQLGPPRRSRLRAAVCAPDGAPARLRRAVLSHAVCALPSA